MRKRLPRTMVAMSQGAGRGTAGGGGGERGGGGGAGGGGGGEPFFHDVDFAEEMAAGHFDGEGGEEEDGSVDPEDGRRGEKMPVGDDIVGGVDVDRALPDEEGANEDGEEDEVASEAGEHSHAIADELLAWTVTARVAGVPVFVAAAAAGG